MKTQILIGIAALAWLLVTYAVGVFVYFPETALIERIRWEVQEQSDGDLALNVDRLRPWRLSGFSAQNINLIKVPQQTRRRRNSDAEEETAQLLVMSEQVNARAELLSLLRGEQAVKFQANVYNGDLSGRVAVGEEATSVVADASDLNLSLIPIAGEEWSVDASGRLNIDVDMNINNQVKNSTGTIRLNIEDMTIEGGEVMGFTIDQSTTFSKALLELEADDGKLEIQEGTFTSDPVSIDISGYVTLARTIRRMRMRIDIKLTLSETLDRFAKGVPMVKDARDEDGMYHFTLSGTPQSPRFSEDRSVMRRNRATGEPGAARRRIEDSIQAQEAGLSDEEVQQVRADRMQRMRDRMNNSRPNRERPSPGLGREDRGPIGMPDERGEPFIPGDELIDDDEDFEDDDEPINDDEFDDEPFDEMGPVEEF